MKKNKIKVVLYCRVGSGEQAEHMLRNQKERLEQGAKEAGLKITDTIWDMGTGQSMERAGWKAVLEAAKQKKMQVLLVASSDRISRNHLHCQTELRKLGELGVQAYSLKNDLIMCYLAQIAYKTKGDVTMKRITTEELCAMNESEGLIIQGCGGDLSVWVDGINGMLTEQGILQKGSDFHNISVFEHDGRTNLLFHMDGVDLDMGRLTKWRIATYIQYRGTWLSDYLSEHLGVNMEEKSQQKEKPDCPLIGQDGNIFQLASIASHTLRENNRADQVDQMWNRIKNSGSYDEALCIIGEYVDITSVEEIKEQIDNFDMKQSY